MKQLLTVLACTLLVAALGAASGAGIEERSEETTGKVLPKGDPAEILAKMTALRNPLAVPVHTFGNDAGCNNPGTVFPDYVGPGVPDAGNCPFTVNEFAPAYAYYESGAPAGRGPLSGSGGDGFGSVSFRCTEGAQTVVDFAAETVFELGAGACEVTLNGSNPTTWATNSGYCWFGPIKCVYADNLVDIVDHALA